MFWKACLTGLAVASMALAQGGMGGGGGMGGSGGGMGTMGGGAGREVNPSSSGAPPRAVKETKAQLMADRLKLNKDQMQEAQTILESTEKDASTVIQQVMETRQQYATALVNGKTGADLDTAQKAMSDAQFQMMGVEVKAFQRIVALLKPNQVAKAPEAFDLMADIFMPATMGAGRGGGGGGGGRRGGGGGR